MLHERTALAPAPTSQLDHQRLASEVLRACVLGDASAVRELLDQSAPVVPPALFAAVQGGHAEVVALLAANPNVDVNRCLANGCSPLFRAASLGHTDCAARLLDANAAVDLLGDILTNASYDAGKVEAERSVILRENQEVNSIPEEVVMDYLHATAFQVGLHAGLRAHTHTHTHIHTHCLSVWSIQLFFVADLRPGSSSPAAAFIAAQTSPLGYTILGPEENIKCVFHCPADRESATCCVHCRCCSHCHHALHCTALSCADTRGVSCRAFFFLCVLQVHHTGRPCQVRRDILHGPTHGACRHRRG